MLTNSVSDRIKQIQRDPKFNTKSSMEYIYTYLIYVCGQWKTYRYSKVVPAQLSGDLRYRTIIFRLVRGPVKRACQATVVFCNIP
jgi:hypothetical protein